MAKYSEKDEERIFQIIKVLDSRNLSIKMSEIVEYAIRQYDYFQKRITEINKMYEEEEKNKFESLL